MNFWKRSSSKHDLIIDISAGSIGVAVVELSDGTPKILSSTRSTFHLPRGTALEAREKAMIKSLEDALKRTKGLSKEVHKVFISFSAPWLLPRLETRTISPANPFLLDEKMITDILKEEEDKFRKILKEEFVEETVVFESKVTGIYQNGYRAKLPMRRKVPSAEVRLIMSATKADLVQKIEDQILKTVGIKDPPILSSFMHTFLDVLTGSFKEIHSALLVSQTSETTDLLFLSHGSSILNTSVPFGIQHILDEISRSLAVPESIAYSYLALYAEGDLDSSMSAAIDRILFDAQLKLKALWSKNGFDLEAHSDRPFMIFLVGLHPLEIISRTFLENLFPGHHVITMGEDSEFTKGLVSFVPHLQKDERLTLLSLVSKFVS